MENNFYFVVGDYCATGEGRTVMLMITRPMIRWDDYEVKPSNVKDSSGNWAYTEGVLKLTLDEIVLRDFQVQFGDWFGRCGQIVTSNVFLDNYGEYLPEKVKEIVFGDSGLNLPYSFSWFSQTHINGS